MILKNFYINIVIRLVLIFITGFLILPVIQRLPGEYLFTLLGIGLILTLQIIHLFRFINQVNRNITRFFSAVKNEDSMLIFQEAAENKHLRDLYQSMRDLNERLLSVRAEGQKQSLLLTNLVNNIGIGIILYYDTGAVRMINQAAKELLNLSTLNHISKLKGIEADLYDRMINLQPGRPEVVRVIQPNRGTNMHGTVKQLLLKKDMIKTEGETLNTITIQNIVREMERKELDSWQKLIRVLTHEIMNSVSPILSLTRSISAYFIKGKEDQPIQPMEINPDTVKKTVSGLHTIQETGEGLIDFVGKYRTLSRLPEPQFAPFKIETLFNRVKKLMQEEMEKKHISLKTTISEANLELVADINLVEKVLINLVKNAAEAMDQEVHGNIVLKAMKNQNSIVLQVEDDGTGIPADIMEDIFVPFFTTKTSGSGIGLSLSRQIMLQHEGTLSVYSIQGEKTVFTLKF